LEFAPVGEGADADDRAEVLAVAGCGGEADGSSDRLDSAGVAFEQGEAGVDALLGQPAGGAYRGGRLEASAELPW
jgi:hypothetical protein